MPVIKRVMIIAGSDSGGGAGIQADIKTCEATGTYSMTAITALTAQNTIGVHSVCKVDSDMLKKQIEVCRDDIGWDAVKIGMLPDKESVQIVSTIIKSHKFVVTDPVMVATSGDRLVSEETMEVMKNELFPNSLIITPNIHEALEIISEPNTIISSVDDMKIIAKKLYSICKTPNILVKGGHLSPPQTEASDVLYMSESDSYKVFVSPFVNTRNTHGTGCTLSSAISSYLAQGRDVPDAVELAKQYLYRILALSADLKIGTGKQGPMMHSLHRKVVEN